MTEREIEPDYVGDSSSSSLSSSASTAAAAAAMLLSTSSTPAKIQRRDTDLVAERCGVPHSIAEPALVTYRSVGIGLFGVVMRFSGMPLEKMALYMNSSQVKAGGTSQFAQAFRLTFRDGALAPFRVVGSASIIAWFCQYSVMGFAFQFVDHSLSNFLNVKPVYYGSELMEPAIEEDTSMEYRAKSTFKTLLSPMLAAALETQVSNRAEVQRFYGKETFARVVDQGYLKGANALRKMSGPAFAPCMMRNVIMCQTTFVLTPITYKLYFPQEQKNKSTLFWYGLGMNIFVGNVVAITQQALWGRTLDHLARAGSINYSTIIKDGLRQEGMGAFFTIPRWFSRVLMNCPAQGVLPWFYNEVLPLGEVTYLTAVKTFVYQPFLKELSLLKEKRIGATSQSMELSSSNPKRL
jgi:hypothetical protein